MLNEVFSESFAQKKNYLTEIDTRIKIVFTVMTMIMILLSRNINAPLVVFLLSSIFLWAIRIPVKVILIRLATPLGLAGVIFLIQIFFYGVTPIVRFNLWGIHLVGYKEGLLRGSLIMAKVVGATSLVTFLSMTTPVNKLFNAARWFRVSNAWIEIAMFTYRYIFVLLEDTVTIKNAQKVRLGYSSLARSLRSFGELMGSTVIRTYDRSVAVYESMMLRGYNGTMQNIAWEEEFRIKDAIVIIVFIIILGSLLVLNTLLY